MKVSDMIIQKLEYLFGHLSHLAQAVSYGCLQHVPYCPGQGDSLKSSLLELFFQIGVFQNMRVWQYKLMFH